MPTLLPTRKWLDALLATLTDEGLRLFFPVSAIYAALWPFMWAVLLGFDLPLARSVPATLWHPHEMLVGAYGAALIGFVTTAVPEWTDSPGLSTTALLRLALLWGIGRAVGVLGFDAVGAVGAAADIAWMAALLGYVAKVSLSRHTTRLLAFVFWLLLLLAAESITRYGFIAGDIRLSQSGIRAIGLAYLGLLGVALARIYVPVINTVLDPSETTSPYRPHPGRQNLAPGLLVVAIAAEVLDASGPVRGYLAIAAGAAFLDRAGEAFIGRRFFRVEILSLFMTPVAAGTGLLLLGASRLGAALPESTGTHIALMGGLGLGVMTVFSIAGLLHTSHALAFPRASIVALAFLACAVVVRVLPDIAPRITLPISHYAASAIIWAAAFGVWLKAYWPLFRDPSTTGRRGC